MTARMPQILGPESGLRSGADAIADELASETAAALGRMGRGVETTLKALSDADANGIGGEARETLLKSAADAVWRYFVQREVSGIRNQKDAIAHYGISKEVLNRVGAH